MLPHSIQRQLHVTNVVVGLSMTLTIYIHTYGEFLFQPWQESEVRLVAQLGRVQHDKDALLMTQFLFGEGKLPSDRQHKWRYKKHQMVSVELSSSFLVVFKLPFIFMTKNI